MWCKMELEWQRTCSVAILCYYCAMILESMWYSRFSPSLFIHFQSFLLSLLFRNSWFNSTHTMFPFFSRVFHTPVDRFIPPFFHNSQIVILHHFLYHGWAPSSLISQGIKRFGGKSGWNPLHFVFLILLPFSRFSTHSPLSSFLPSSAPGPRSNFSSERSLISAHLLALFASLFRRKRGRDNEWM